MKIICSRYSPCRCLPLFDREAGLDLVVYYSSRFLNLAVMCLFNAIVVVPQVFVYTTSTIVASWSSARCHATAHATPLILSENAFALSPTTHIHGSPAFLSFVALRISDTTHGGLALRSCEFADSQMTSGFLARWLIIALISPIACA